jgi:hypothetical protein
MAICVKPIIINFIILFLQTVEIETYKCLIMKKNIVLFLYFNLL